MTIGLVTPYFPDEETIDSGIANHCMLLARELASLGNKVIVLHVRPHYKNDDDRVNEKSIGENITVITYKISAYKVVSGLFKGKWAVIDFAQKLRGMLVTARVLNKVIKKYGIQIIETSSYFSLCYFSLYKKINVPVVVRVSTTFAQIMNDHYPFKSRGMDAIAKMEIALIKKSRYLITHAHSHAQELENLYHIDKSLFQIIPHGINLPAINTAKPVENPVIKILYVGRLEYRKGIDVLLQAIPLIIQDYSNIAFEIIGSDTGNDYQTEFIKNNPESITQRVVFSGKVDAVSLARAYHNCDIFVAPSRYESFGLIYIEAMSYGKPVIGSNVGGVSEIIQDGYNGLFAQTGDACSYAAKIKHLIDNAALRTEMGLNARKIVADKFTGRQLALSSLAYYQKIIPQLN